MEEGENVHHLDLGSSSAHLAAKEKKKPQIKMKQDSVQRRLMTKRGTRADGEKISGPKAAGEKVCSKNKAHGRKREEEKRGAPSASLGKKAVAQKWHLVSKNTKKTRADNYDVKTKEELLEG